jgi:hypothetical protein
MARKEDIMEAAYKIYGDQFSSLWGQVKRSYDFIRGAEWADEHPNLISTFDSVPDNDDWVLTLCRNHKDKIELFYMLGKYTKENGWEFKGEKPDEVSYWMKPPKFPLDMLK